LTVSITAFRAHCGNLDSIATCDHMHIHAHVCAHRWTQVPLMPTRVVLRRVGGTTAKKAALPTTMAGLFELATTKQMTGTRASFS
jgi:hypothetical protein